MHENFPTNTSKSLNRSNTKQEPPKKKERKKERKKENTHLHVTPGFINLTNHMCKELIFSSPLA
jgi:hypothetical protein